MKMIWSTISFAHIYNGALDNPSEDCPIAPGSASNPEYLPNLSNQLMKDICFGGYTQ